MKKKILVLKFSEEDLNKMNQMKIKINQFETEKKNNERYKEIMKNKHFIFYISLTRQKLNNNKNKNKNKKSEEKIMINDLISNIDEEYSQFFIDNIHGNKNSNIINIMTKTPSDYINNIFNENKNNLLKIIHRIFSYLTYEYKNDKIYEKKKIDQILIQDFYIKEIIYKLSKNEYILNLIKEKIEKQFGGNINEIINYIFQRGDFGKNDIEFIDIIYKSINDKIFHLLLKFIFKSEKDHFLRPFLFNYEFISQEKENLTYIEKYINDFNFNLVNVIERIHSNQILLILNLSLPLSKKWYDLINVFIENNIKENYMNNEENLRISIFEENEINQEMEKYSKIKNDFIDNVKGELLRINGLNDLIKTKNVNYMKMIYIDFMTIYLTKKFKDNIDIGIQFLDILIQLKFNNKDLFFENNRRKISFQGSFDNKNEESNIKYDEETLSKIIIFLICYSDEIYLMLEIFFTLQKYVNNFFDEWKEIITEKDLKYEISNNVPIYTKEVNESFFIIYESLIKFIFFHPEKYLEIREDVFYEYLNSIQKLSKTAIQIYRKLYLPSKEMYNLQILINIFSSFNSCKMKKVKYNIQDIFYNIINIIYNENYFIINKIYQSLEENYQSLQIILDDLIDKESNEKEYSLLLNNLFIYRFNKSLDKEYRKTISILFFNDITNSQLKYIIPILKRLIDDVEPKNRMEEELTEQECENSFLNKFINVDNDYLELYKIINDKNVEILDLNILYYFECECELYFRKISNGKKLKDIEQNNANVYMNNILLNLSFKYFKKAMSYYLDEKEFNLQVKKLGKIYCVAYIKNYLKKLSEFITYNINKNIFNFEEIFSVLLQKSNNKKIFSLKIFLFKCLFNNENKNYLEFIEIISSKNVFKRILNHDDFKNIFSTNNENKHSYNFSFLNINTFKYYCNLNSIIELSIDNFENNKDFNGISNYFKNNNYQGLDIIYNILINRYIFDLHGKVNNNENLSANANIVFNKLSKVNNMLNQNSKTIINYLIKKDLFNSKILPKLKLKNNITSEQLYILLLCIKYVLSLQCYENIFFLFYIDKNFKGELLAFLNENYIPGAFPLQNEFIDSYYEIEKHILNQPPDSAIYMCSCGRYYNILPCGYPIKRSRCLKCNQVIGGINHRLERRRGHYRIFLNEKIRDQEFQKTFADVTMPYKYLHEFKRDVIDPLLKKPNKGIGKMTKEVINKTGNNIRNIDELSFRILNFVLCSHLLVANILDILDNKDITKFFSEETSCFGIILDNWNKIIELLNKKGINNIQIYMNIILESIIDIIRKHEIFSLNTYQGRDNIEKEINAFIIGDNNINNKIKLYEQQNQQILNSSHENISSLIQELYPRKFYNNENEYPYFKYLYYYNYPSFNNLYDIIESNNNYKIQYPLTYNIIKKKIDNNKDIEKLEYIPKINKKLNYLIQNYSYKISRDEALKKTIEEEYNKPEDNLFIININKNDNKDRNAKQYIKDLINLFNEFKNIDLQWGCHKLQKMELSSESKLATLLLDDNEPGYYLSSIYKKLIEYQNVFLDNIINCNAQNGLLHCFEKQLNNEIMVQDAGVNEILKLNFEANNNLKLYSNLDELIVINTTNDITTNKFNYELDQIEIELGNIILPGVRKFKASDDELRFITYMFEGYRGKNSNILTNFNEKYPPQELTTKEKAILNYYIQENENEDYKQFLCSIQLLIDYIQKAGKDKDMPIGQIIKNIPEHINIDEKVKLFFDNKKEFTVNKLVRIFELFEYLCWNQIMDNILDEFRKPLDEEKKKLILNNKYFKEYNDKEYNIKKIELASAIRKFLSRYIAGKRSQSEINEDKMLFDYLNRVDLWARNIEDEKFEMEYFVLSSLKITVGEGKAFYDLLVGDLKLLDLKKEGNPIKKIEQKIDIEMEINNNQNNKIRINDENEEEINTSSKIFKRNITKENIKKESNNNIIIQKKKPKRKLY